MEADIPMLDTLYFIYLRIFIYLYINPEGSLADTDFIRDSKVPTTLSFC